MWEYPGRVLHVIVLTLFGIWVTSEIANNIWPHYHEEKVIKESHIKQ